MTPDSCGHSAVCEVSPFLQISASAAAAAAACGR